MRSMTGYAWLEEKKDRYQVSLEIKSCNNKYLDINLNLAQNLSALDERIRDAVRRVVERGRIDITVRIRELLTQNPWELDEELFERGLHMLQRAKQLAGDTSPVQIESVLALEGVVRSDSNRDYKAMWLAFEPMLQQALQQFNLRRHTEGTATKLDLENLLARISTARTKILTKADSLEIQFRDALSKRFTEVLGDSFDENRLLQELAVMLTRYSIHEELARLDYHIKAMSELLNADGSIAKRLEFLAQELHREANTIGSKSMDPSVSEWVIDMKEAIDSIREQVRNIE